MKNIEKDTRQLRKKNEKIKKWTARNIDCFHQIQYSCGFTEFFVKNKLRLIRGHKFVGLEEILQYMKSTKSPL